MTVLRVRGCVCPEGGAGKGADEIHVPARLLDTPPGSPVATAMAYHALREARSWPERYGHPSGFVCCLAIERLEPDGRGALDVVEVREVHPTAEEWAAYLRSP